MMNKVELRKTYLAKRAALTTTEREAASRAIAKNFFAHISLNGVHTLHCYLSIERFNEIDTNQIIHYIWKNHPQIRIVVPRIDTSTDELESVLYTCDTEVKHNSWLIPEPPEGELVDAASVDLVIVPLICTDRAGHRVGYGKGYYDRFLAGTRRDCLKVGLSFFPPVERIEDVHGGDVAIDQCITPEGIFRGDAEVI